MRFVVLLLLASVVLLSEGHSKNKNKYKKLWKCVGRNCRGRGPPRWPGIFVHEPEYVASSLHNWNYTDLNWGALYPHCDGQRQSPINIVTDRITNEAPYIELVNYDNIPSNLTLKNNGYTVTMYADKTTASQAASVVFNQTVYRLVNAHFHWSNENVGTEHAIDGEKGALEMHLVHSAETGSTENDKLVIAILFHTGVSGEHLEGLELLRHHLPRVRSALGESDVEAFPMSKLIPTTPAPYYVYEGSLTTPPCSEDVIFAVYSAMLPIYNPQLQEFLHLRDENGQQIVNNYRPVQYLNGREVYRSAVI